MNLCERGGCSRRDRALLRSRQLTWLVFRPEHNGDAVVVGFCFL